jgi:hypothetical protein
MSLEDSMNTLAKAMDKYADALTAALNADPKKFVIVNMTNVPAADVAAATPAATEPAQAAAKPGRKSKAEKEAEAAAAAAAAGEADAFGEDAVAEAAGEEDPFGEAAAEPAAPKLDQEAIRGLVLKVKTEKGADIAKKLLEHVGVKTLGAIAEKDYQKVVDLAKKVGVSL